MATLREVRNRIKSVRQTQKITRAMKMVAAAKLRRAQSRVLAARPYARTMKALLAHLSRVADPSMSDLVAPRAVKTVALVVVTSDRGFCGGFNANLMKAAQSHLGSLPAGVGVKVVAVGKKGVDFFTKRNFHVISRHIGVYQDLTFTQAQRIAGELIAAYRAGEFDRVDVVYNEFKSVGRSNIAIEQFLPIPQNEEESPSAPPSDYIYEPDRLSILLSLIPRHLNFQVWRMLLESSTAEEGARMAAMENATENANELISTLQLQYNKARQWAITKELLEVVSGAEALISAQ